MGIAARQRLTVLAPGWPSSRSAVFALAHATGRSPFRPPPGRPPGGPGRTAPPWRSPPRPVRETARSWRRGRRPRRRSTRLSSIWIGPAGQARLRREGRGEPGHRPRRPRRPLALAQARVAALEAGRGEDETQEALEAEVARRGGGDRPPRGRTAEARDPLRAGWDAASDDRRTAPAAREPSAEPRPSRSRTWPPSWPRMPVARRGGRRARGRPARGRGARRAGRRVLLAGDAAAASHARVARGRGRPPRLRVAVPVLGTPVRRRSWPRGRRTAGRPGARLVREAERAGARTRGGTEQRCPARLRAVASFRSRRAAPTCSSSAAPRRRRHPQRPRTPSRAYPDRDAVRADRLRLLGQVLGDDDLRRAHGRAAPRRGPTSAERSSSIRGAATPRAGRQIDKLLELGRSRAGRDAPARPATRGPGRGCPRRAAPSRARPGRRRRADPRAGPDRRQEDEHHRQAAPPLGEERPARKGSRARGWRARRPGETSSKPG